MASVFLVLAPTDVEKMLAGSMDKSTGESVALSGLALVMVSPADIGGSIRAGVLAPDTDVEAEAATPPSARNISSSVYKHLNID